MTIKLIVGLANPGIKYALTRHNIGAWYVHSLAEQLKIDLHEQSKFYGFTSCVNLFSTDVHLFVPKTFMNLSGTAVEKITTFYHISPEEILVAHDELDLPPGVAKFKYGGSHGGHNGLRNIIKKLGNNSNFYRLRIGIRYFFDKKEKGANFVLDKPSSLEQRLIKRAIKEAINCTNIWLKEGLTKATNQLHSFKAK